MKKIKSLVAVALTACLAMSNSFAGNGTFTIKNDLTEAIHVKVPGDLLIWGSLDIDMPAKSQVSRPDGGYDYTKNFSIWMLLNFETSGHFTVLLPSATHKEEPPTPIGGVDVTLSGENPCQKGTRCYEISDAQTSSKPGYSIVASGTPAARVVTISTASQK